ncbi:MAG: hypothetical protein CFE23_08240 [Flavobacterium sp. BFFFF1]|uniref:T9SS type A sorting domain-containing protein n=1 Tax=Flavobacterium sp. BFFFF1 TaxID=2015557 RepID=UPI000BC7D482|nr:T9SS type A sorting domain-containing protein [Flavobacterium sp. BFFFF1]OYU80700.1 MAG: hypothetical protein CFE23_08240 [Flavobacterium sp. BFFFF1]
MKKFYLWALLILVSSVSKAQITPTNYRGAFAPAPIAMWTDSWTNYDPQNTVYPTTAINVNTNITTNTTWTTGNTYKLQGQIYVKNNATLTIQPGVVVLGDQISNGAGLFITKGAKLNAVGTAANPIVFTSDKPAGQRNRGDWGGIILLGKASFNINGGVNNIEGIAPTADTQYGGGTTPNDNDSSGTLKYVRIEYAGYVYAPNNEINGLTFGAVGRGTVVDYVQVSFSNDDAFEWFGGSVDCKHLVSYRNLDDDFDTDNGYNGRVQFCLSVRDPQIADAPSVSTSEGFESDNNAAGSAVSPYTSAIFSNMTMVGPTFRTTLANGGSLAAGYKRAARIRRNSQLKIFNSIFVDYLEGLHIDGIACENNVLAGTLKFNNNILAGITTTSKVLQVTSPGTITAGNNPSFNMTSWYAASNNTTVASSNGLLAAPYNTSNALTYTGLDYRPASNSIALSGANFTDSAFAGMLSVGEPIVTSSLKYCQNQVVPALTATLVNATSLKWYTVPALGSASLTAPTPSTAIVGTKYYYVSQVSNGVEGPRAVIEVVVLPLATRPAMITGPDAVCNYVGTTTPVTYSIPAVADAVSYQWSVPTGVTLVSTATDGLSIIVHFNNVPAGAGNVGNISVSAVSAAGCNSALRSIALSKTLPYRPGSIAVKNAAGSSINTSLFGNYVGTAIPVTFSVAAVPSAQTYQWDIPAGAQILSGDGTNTITVSFQNASTEVGVFVVSVKSVAQCGVSTPRNVGLTKALPLAPAVITPSLTNVCAVVGTGTAVTYSVAPNPFYSFIWTVPAGASISGASNGSTISVIYSNDFTSTGVVTVKAVNGVGPSLPKTITVSRNLPSLPGLISGQNYAVCSGTPYTYTFPGSAYASYWIITVPTGAVVKTANHPSNTSNVLTTNETSFTVVYPANYVSGSSISITAYNGCGSNPMPSTMKVYTTLATPLSISGPATIECSMIGVPQTYSTPIDPQASGYIWTAPANATIVSGQGTNTVQVTFSEALVSGTILSVAKTGTVCGAPTQTSSKKLTLTKPSCGPAPRPENTVQSKEATYSELYPNPTNGNFNVDVVLDKASKVKLVVYSYSGNVVSEKTYDIAAGKTSLNTDISTLPGGLYFVKLIDSATDYVVTKKVLKR